MTLPRLIFIVILCFGAYQGFVRFGSSHKTAAEIESADPSRQIQIYTTRNCGVCAQAKAYMKSHGIAYRELDVEGDMDVRRDFYAQGGRGVPWIWIGRERMEGFDVDRFEELRRSAGLT
jgi:glutaredoxin